MVITPEDLKKIIKDAVSSALTEYKEKVSLTVSELAITKQACSDRLEGPLKMTLSIDELAEVSGIGRDKLRELTYKPGFPCFNVGKKTLINREKFIEWLNRISEQKEII